MSVASMQLMSNGSTASTTDTASQTGKVTAEDSHMELCWLLFVDESFDNLLP